MISSNYSTQFSPLLMMFLDYMDNKQEYDDNGIRGSNTYQEAIQLISNSENETFKTNRLPHLSNTGPDINMYFRKKINRIVSEIDRLSDNYNKLETTLVDMDSASAETLLRERELYYNIPGKNIRNLHPVYPIYSHLETQKRSKDIVHLFVYDADLSQFDQLKHIATPYDRIWIFTLRDNTAHNFILD